jgi:outer membrane protein assembly factor BamB
MKRAPHTGPWSPSRRRVCGSLLLAAFGCLGGVGQSAVASFDWYRWRGPELNGISKETGWLATWPKEGPKQLWKAAVGQGYSSVSVSHGRLYTMGVVGNADEIKDGQETVSCLHAETGATIWKKNYPYAFEPKYYDGGSSATPTVDGNRVFTFGQNGTLNCFDAASGEIVWSKNIQKDLGCSVGAWGFASSPLVQDNLLILNAASAGTAVDKATGKVVWTTGKDANGYSSPVPFTMGGRRGVALFVARAVVGVDVQTGQELWRHPWKTDYDVNAADPIIEGDQVFISSGYKRGAALFKITDGKTSVVWENKNMRNHVNSCVLLDGCLYGPDDDMDRAPYLRCVELKTGEIKWTFKDFPCSASIAADGKLIVQGAKGELMVAEAKPDACKVVSKAQVLGGRCWTTPVLSNGRIYARNSQGDLACLDVRGK